MGGGLMQLVAYGAQDVYLTGNPQITFFKVVYRRHTNFSMECIRQTMSGIMQLGGKGTATISRNGDLISQIYMTYKLSNGSRDGEVVSNFGNALIKNAEVEIGGQLIDRQDGRFMQLHSDLTEPNPTSNPCGLVKYQKMAGIGANLNEVAGVTDDYSTTTKKDVLYWVPLKFWFCRNPGLALPLIALQYHEVKVSVELEEASKLTTKGSITNSDDFSKNDCNLWVDYIYLDTDERRRFAQVSHEYLIEQVQVKKSNVNVSDRDDIDLNFNHPVKELIWVFTGSSDDALKNGFFPGCGVQEIPDDDVLGTGEGSSAQVFDISSANDGEKQYMNTKKSIPSETTFKLTLNGQDRFQERDSFYFANTQVWKHHTGSGSPFPVGAIHVYSFALKPEEHQPSGTCNFSRIDSSKLNIEYPTNPGGELVKEIHVYAINYNVLRIMSGMGGLAYSN